MTGRIRPIAKLAALVGGLMLVAVGCSNAPYPQTTLSPKGPEAQKIQNLIIPVFAIAAVVFVIVIFGTLYIVIRFRARGDEDPEAFPEQLHGNFKLEIGWTIIPAVILLFVAIGTVATIFDLAKKPEPNALKVEVIGQQWWWEYRYSYDFNGDGKPDKIITANDMVIPAGRQISLRIKSNDVIHSWWAPALNGKKDAVPGRVHPLTIQADKPGTYIGQCTEFCGLSHAQMRIRVIAMSDADFMAWGKKQIQPFEAPTAGAAKRGFTQFASQCTGCHRITGMTQPDDSSKLYVYKPPVLQVSRNAPNLTKFATRDAFAGAMFDLRKDTPACQKLGLDWASTKAGITKCLNRPQLEAWLRDPPAQKAMAPGVAPTVNSRGMPNFNLNEDQIDDLVAFLMTLQ